MAEHGHLKWAFDKLLIEQKLSKYTYVPHIFPNIFIVRIMQLGKGFLVHFTQAILTEAENYVDTQNFFMK